MEDRMSFYELNMLRRKNNLYVIFGIILILAAIVCFMMSVGSGYFAILSVVLTVMAIVLFVKKGRIKKEFNRIYKKEVVEAVLKRHFENVDYRWEEGFPSGYVANMALIAHGNCYHSEDYLSASYKGVNFEQSDVVIEEETTDGDGNTTTTTYFRGRIIVIDYPKQTGFVRTTSRKFRFAQHLRKKEYQSVEMENVAFNKVFYTYAHDSVDAFYLFTPPMMEKLMEIAGTYGNVGLSCYNGKLNIAINTKGDAFDAKMTKSLKYDREMERINNDAALIERLIETIYGSTGEQRA